MYQNHLGAQCPVKHEQTAWSLSFPVATAQPIFHLMVYGLLKSALVYSCSGRTGTSEEGNHKHTKYFMLCLSALSFFMCASSSALFHLQNFIFHMYQSEPVCFLNGNLSRYQKIQFRELAKATDRALIWMVSHTGELASYLKQQP